MAKHPWHDPSSAQFLFEKKQKTTGLLQGWSHDVWACQTLDTNKNYSQVGNGQIFIYN